MNMDRRIFELNASINATSLYILLCALSDEGVSPTLNDARSRWNGTVEDLTSAAEELMRRNVLEKMDPLDPGQPIKIKPVGEWHH